MFVKQKHKKTEIMKAQIQLLEENIKRLELQILSAFTFQKGYIDNCKSAIESYKKQIEKLKTIN
jgi:hypothetical protein